MPRRVKRVRSLLAKQSDARPRRHGVHIWRATGNNLPGNLGDRTWQLAHKGNQKVKIGSPEVHRVLTGKPVSRWALGSGCSLTALM
jgi:hypothetical protein